MSYERAETFTEDTDATATTVESEFDNIADYFNSLFQEGHLAASAKPALGAAFVDIAGTNKTITVVRASILRVEAIFDVAVEEGSTFQGVLNVDGAAQTKEAVVVAQAGGNSNWRGCVPQVYRIPLGVGSHDLKLQGKKNGTAEIFDLENTGYSYLLIPEP